MSHCVIVFRIVFQLVLQNYGTVIQKMKYDHMKLVQLLLYAFMSLLLNSIESRNTEQLNLQRNIELEIMKRAIVF